MTSEIIASYQILELEVGASLEQVKQAWRELVKVWHPDRFPNDAKMQRKAEDRLNKVNGAYELLSQFLTSESGSKSSSFAARYKTGGSSPEPTAGEATPPDSESSSQQSSSKISFKWTKWKIFGIIILFICILVYSENVISQYDSFKSNLYGVSGIRLGDSREQVKYRLGFPKEVIGPKKIEEAFGGYPVYTVDAPPGDINIMPHGTKLDDYSEWLYETYIYRLTIEFNESGLVESLNLFTDSEETFGWTAVADLDFGDSEEAVLRLGTPTGQFLSGVTKKIEYQDLGIEVFLAKGRAYMVRIKGPTDNTAVLRRFIQTLF
jgi:hypothetical protein